MLHRFHCEDLRLLLLPTQSAAMMPAGEVSTGLTDGLQQLQAPAGGPSPLRNSQFELSLQELPVQGAPLCLWMCQYRTGRWSATANCASASSIAIHTQCLLVNLPLCTRSLDTDCMTSHESQAWFCWAHVARVQALPNPQPIPMKGGKSSLGIGQA